MKIILLSKNKFIRSILYILLYFFVLIIVELILMFNVGREYSSSDYKGSGLWENIYGYWNIFLKFTGWPTFLLIVQQVWFGKLKPKLNITRSKDLSDKTTT